MGPEEEPRSGKQKGLALLGSAVSVLFVAAVGLYTFLTTMGTPLHPNPQRCRRSASGPRRQSGPTRWNRGGSSPGRVSSSRICRDCRWPSASVATSCGPKALAGRISRSGCPSRQIMRFRIGHASKALTSAAVGLLLEKGRLDLDDEIQTYVPAFPRKQWPVTLRQLMGHVAGVRHYENEEDYMPSAHCERASEGLAEFRG